ncbi:hypothetical protein ACN23B_12865 [Anabaena sp. FACHB-709]|nr:MULTISPECIES: hypothetical protein [Nostocaceae]HBW29924.1 hypothetical protein [Nostoc sp. UBA8866]MBD2169732.1 hypothetical protein [Anabaena cylindrica FACHB-318]MBD2261849.1 hypothetical protein [Anabaena sp. FACHB-709]MBD2271434.1 hypothetical protein [Nostoc sp. PCC 7120 = FACHB-418]MBD2282296.1 hypothetical protein [Anabaena cylindrica FACHB-170]
MKSVTKLSSIAILLCSLVYPPLLTEAKATTINNSIDQQSIETDANLISNQTEGFLLAQRRSVRRRYVRPVVRGRYTRPVVRGRYTRPVVRGRYTRPVVRGRYVRPVVRGRYVRPVVRGRYIRR